MALTEITWTFQSTLPVGGATCSSGSASSCVVISIHAPRGGSDWIPGRTPAFVSTFQSTLPVGGATISDLVVYNKPKISIHAPRGGSDDIYSCWDMGLLISIHAPRGGSDGCRPAPGRSQQHFNPRSPWGERRHSAGGSVPAPPFQSTLPVGGATASVNRTFAKLAISIHAPRGGSDRKVGGKVRKKIVFQSTLPVGGATKRDGCGRQRSEDFNPRSPWGERLTGWPPMPSSYGFQSTLPVGGATQQMAQQMQGQFISIHAPRGGSDAASQNAQNLTIISIHAPRGGSDE